MDGRCRVKLRSLATICSLPSTEITCNQQDISVTQNSKSQKFLFDHCVTRAGHEDISGVILSQLDASVNMTILGFNSTLLSYDSSDESSQNGVDSTCDLTAGLLTKLVFKLFISLNKQQCSVDTTENTSSYTVTVCCFETLDSQVRDLLIDQPYGVTGLKANKNIRLREKNNNEVFIDGLTSFSVENSEEVSSLLTSALNKRCCLVVVPVSEPGAQQSAQQRQSVVVGPVGNVFVQLSVKQVVHVPDKGVTLTKESTLEVVSLATSETLTFRLPSSSASSGVSSSGGSDVLVCMSRQEAKDSTTSANSNGSSGASTDAVKSATTLLLSGCLKSLSTLTRVVQVLRGNTATPGTSIPSAGDVASTSATKTQGPTKKKHVPYRDSVLTRLLRRSLHGNCYMAMLTFVTAANGVDNVARILRFAAEIGGLYNYISINQQVLQSAAGTLHRTAAVVDADAGSDVLRTTETEGETEEEADAPVDDHDQESDQEDNNDLASIQRRHAQFSSLFDLMQSGMEALSGDLSKLSADLLAASLLVAQPAKKQYKDSLTNRRNVSHVEDDGIVASNLADALLSESTDGQNAASLDQSSSQIQITDKDTSVVPPSQSSKLKSTQSSGSLSVGTGASDTTTSSASTTSRINSVSSGGSSKTTSKLRNVVDGSKQQSSGSSAGKSESTASNKAANSSGAGSDKVSTSKQAGNGKTATTLTSSTPPRASVDKTLLSTTNLSAKVATQGKSKPLTAEQKSTKREPAPLIASTSFSNVSNKNTPGPLPSLEDANRPRAVKVSVNGIVLAKATLSLPAIMMDEVVPTGETVDVMTESRKTINILNIFDMKMKDWDGESGGLTDRSGTDESSTPPSKLPPIRGNVFVPPVVQMITANDIKTTFGGLSSTKNSQSAATDGIKGSQTNVSGSLFSGQSAKLPDITSPNRNNSVDASGSSGVRGGAVDRSGDMSDEEEGDDASPVAKKSLFVVEKKVSAPVYVDKYNLNGEEVSPKKVFVPKRRFQVEEDDDSGGDDLSEPERRFLRQCAAGQVPQAEKSLQLGVNIHVKNNFERDAMQICARNGSVPMLTMLIQHGGLLSSRGPKGDTLFHLAAWNGHVPTLRWLHTKGILPEAVDILGQTAVHVAARRGEVEVLRYLFEELNLDFQQMDFDGRLPLDHVGRRGGPELEACRNYLHAVTVKLMQGSFGAVASEGGAEDV